MEKLPAEFSKHWLYEFLFAWREHLVNFSSLLPMVHMLQNGYFEKKTSNFEKMLKIESAILEKPLGQISENYFSWVIFRLQNTPAKFQLAALKFGKK